MDSIDLSRLHLGYNLSNIGLTCIGGSHFELNGLFKTLITNQRITFIELSKTGYFKALEYSILFSIKWSSVYLIHQISKPLYLSLHQYCLLTIWWLKKQRFGKKSHKMFDQNLSSNAKIYHSEELYVFYHCS